MSQVNEQARERTTSSGVSAAKWRAVDRVSRLGGASKRTWPSIDWSVKNTIACKAVTKHAPFQESALSLLLCDGADLYDWMVCVFSCVFA